MSGTVIKLKHAIQVEGINITELTLRRPKLKHLRGINLDQMTGDSIIELISRLADIPPSSTEDIDGEDIEAVSEVIGGFFGPSPAIGDSS